MDPPVDLTLPLGCAIGLSEQRAQTEPESLPAPHTAAPVGCLLPVDQVKNSGIFHNSSFSLNPCPLC